MSFMEGFGQAFSAQWARERQNTRQDERDIMNQTFQAYREGEKNRQAAQAKSNERVRAARQIASQLTGVDRKAAFSYAYNMLSSGYDIKDVEERLNRPGGQFVTPGDAREATDTSTRMSNDTRRDLEAQTDEMLAPGPSASAPQSGQEAMMQPVTATGQGAVPQTPPPGPSAPMPEMAGNDPSVAAGQMPGASAGVQAEQASNRPAHGGGLFGSPYKWTDRTRDNAVNTIAQQTGQSPEDIQRTIRGEWDFTPEDLIPVEFIPGKEPQKVSTGPQAMYDLLTSDNPEVLRHAQASLVAQRDWDALTANQKAKAEGLGFQGGPVKYLDENGETHFTQVRRQADGTYLDIEGNTHQNVWEIGKDELTSLNKIMQSGMDKEAQDYRTALSSLPALYKNGYETAELIAANPGLQQAATSGIAQTAYNWAAELQTAAGLVGIDTGVVQRSLENFAKEGGEVTDQDAAELITLESRLTEVLGQDVTNLAVAKTLYNTRIALMAYHIGAMAGQTGRDLQEAERKMFIETAQGGVTYDQFVNNVAGLISDGRAKLDSTYSAISNNSLVRGHQSLYGDNSIPFAVVDNPEEYLNRVMETDRGGLIRRGFDLFSAHDPSVSPIFNRTRETQRDEQGGLDLSGVPEGTPSTHISVNPQTGEVLYWDGTTWVSTNRE